MRQLQHLIYLLYILPIDLISLTNLSIKNIALVAWRSGHRISPRDGRPGFKSRQGANFIGKTCNAVAGEPLWLSGKVME
jgi:hypothetical protein